MILIFQCKPGLMGFFFNIPADIDVFLVGAAIALSALPNVSVSLFEQARELREIGAGIRIGYNCWKVLELLNAAQDVKGHLKRKVDHR